jgi:hypothetical protein
MKFYSYPIIDFIGGEYPFRSEIKNGRQGVFNNTYQFMMDGKVWREFTGPHDLGEVLTSILISTYLRGVEDAVRMCNHFSDASEKKASS